MRSNLRSSKQISLVPIIINLKKTDVGYKVYETEATVITNQLNTQALAKSKFYLLINIMFFLKTTRHLLKARL